MYLSTDGSYENIYDEADQTVIDQIAILINELKQVTLDEILETGNVGVREPALYTA
jgi:hypothetical protein